MANINVFAHLKIRKIDIININNAILTCVSVHKDKVRFQLVGKDKVKQFLLKFSTDNLVNIVSKNGVICKISKGIDVDV